MRNLAHLPMAPLHLGKRHESHRGKLIVDVTARPQDIAYPTNLGVLNSAGEKSVNIIDCLHLKTCQKAAKPQTNLEIARKKFLKTAQKKTKSRKEIWRANGIQLNFLERNQRSIDRLLGSATPNSVNQ